MIEPVIKYLREKRALIRRLRAALRTPKSPIELELESPWFQSYGVKTVIDVGANVGRFATFARTACPDARIFAFEPLADCCRVLRERFRDDRRFQAFDCALGASVSQVQMHRNEYRASSSLLAMADAHKEAFPYTARSSLVTVRVQPLDAALQGCAVEEPIFLKLDVQGYESHVLAGGPRTLARTQLVMLEVSFERMYHDEPLFDDLYRTLYDRGFVLRGIVDMLRRPADQKPLQVDALFERR